VNFADRLLKLVATKKTPLCVGLDPHEELIPDEFFRNQTKTEGIRSFLFQVITAITPFAVAVKPNAAFFEYYGAEGWKIFEEVSEEAQKNGLIVIADAKRNDIGSTAVKYAEAFLGTEKPYDALTITPYLGQDGILPFVDTATKNGKGVFTLVKTSNTSAGEFQDLPVGDALLHEEVARTVARIGTRCTGESEFSSLGAVVGATHPDDIRILRSEMPAQIFLIPGYGFQGGTADDLTDAFYQNGTGAIVNSSRGILFPKGKKTTLEDISAAAEKAQEELFRISFRK
jgi:orotidine-5'-phosphate decarboxylase